MTVRSFVVQGPRTLRQPTNRAHRTAMPRKQSRPDSANASVVNAASRMRKCKTIRSRAAWDKRAVHCGRFDRRLCFFGCLRQTRHRTDPKDAKYGRTLSESRVDAVAGMQALSKDVIALDPADFRELEVMQGKIRKLYELAYTWKPRVAECARVSARSRVRQHIKAWITSWDISRLCGVGDVGIQTEGMKSDYTENQPANEEDVMDELLKDPA